MKNTEIQIYHYPTDLFELLVKTIPKLYWAKKSVLDFFIASGIPKALINDLIDKVNYNRNSIYKHEIAREVLNRINQKTDKYLRQRREIIKRITQFENYSSCCPEDRDEAYGLVAQVRELVNVKDAFTRMQHEKDVELEKHREKEKKKLQEKEKRQEELAKIKSDFYSLFSMNDPQTKGKLLESIMNRLFKVNEILVSEAFTVKGTSGEGIIEQFDGAIKLDGHVYLVEMKWLKEPVGMPDVSTFIGKLFSRGQDARGIFIAYPGFTAPAISIARDNKAAGVNVIFSTIEEFYTIFENNLDLKEFLNQKINASILHKNPFYKPLDIKTS